MYGYDELGYNIDMSSEFSDNMGYGYPNGMSGGYSGDMNNGYGQDYTGGFGQGYGEGINYPGIQTGYYNSGQNEFGGNYQSDGMARCNYNNYGEVQFEFDPATLKGLGFTDYDIQALNMVLANIGKVTPAAMAKCGIDYNYARRIKYMYDICSGRIQIQSVEELIRHLRKMFGRTRRIGIQDLATSTIKRVPRKAVIAGIPKGAFSIYNSKNYPIDERMYEVSEITSTNIVVMSFRRPVLKYKEAKEIPGIIKLDEIKPDGTIMLSVNKQYCRLCNRFMVVASLRRPEFHYGMIQIICIEGTRVYVYAQGMKDGESPSYKGGTQRVYEYGFLRKEIEPKIMVVARMIYKKVCGVLTLTEKANSDFNVISKVETEETDTDAVI